VFGARNIFLKHVFLFRNPNVLFAMIVTYHLRLFVCLLASLFVFLLFFFCVPVIILDFMLCLPVM
jgi:hypothetical protein